LLPVAAFVCAIVLLLSGVATEWFGQKFESLARRIPILATFLILVTVTTIIVLSLILGLRWGLTLSKRNLPKQEQNNLATDSKPEPIPKVVPPSTNPDSPKPDNRHATAHRSAASSPPPIHRTQTFVTFVVFNLNSRHLVCSVDLMKVALCAQLSQAISRNLPLNENSWQKLFDIAIQHFLISLVRYAGTGYGMHTESEGIILKQIPAIDIPDRETFELGRVCTLNDVDRSLLTQDLTSTSTIILPKSSSCSLMSTNIYPFPALLRFERPKYYQLDLNVRLMMTAPKGQVLRGFKVPFADKSQLVI